MSRCLIRHAKGETLKLVNTALIDLYWSVGKYVSLKTANEGWGKSTVVELAKYLAHTAPNIDGFSDKNIWRMKQFYETYVAEPKLSTLLREISWSNNLAIMSRAKSFEEREFYMRHCIMERYSARELQRQISASLFERYMLSDTKLSPVARDIHPDIDKTFRDSYIFEFLGKPAIEDEKGLRKGLVKQMKEFILELGKDFLFI
ncbi:MAG: PDDEXK nuclease domain-containing protein, partial [Rikenellaceae bacterium]